MNRSRLGILPCLGFAAVGIWAVTPALAQHAMPEEGVSGFVTFLPSFVAVESQFQTDDDNRITSNLSNSGKSTTAVAPILTGEVRYTKTDWNTQIYFGLPSETIREGTVLQAELGGRYWLSDGTRFSASFLFPPFVPDETWADPFVTNQARQKSDFDVWGIRLRADRIAGSDFGFRYEYGQLEIDNELSGTFLAAQPGNTLSQSDRDSLRRDAEFHRITGTYAYKVSDKMWLRPAFRYVRRDADGSSNSFDGLRPEVGLAYVAGRIDTTINFAYERQMYDADNPVFDRKRDADVYRGTFAFGYRRPFDLDNVRWEVFATYGIEDSDIEFYDSEIFIAGTGFTYSF